MNLEVGVFLALTCAFATNLGFLLKHRGACAAPAVDIRHPLSSAAGLFKSRWFAIGYAVAAVAFILHVGALALAPISIVQSVISGGIVLMAAMAERFFGYHLGARQWMGIALTAAGMVLLAITVPHGGGEQTGFSLPALIAFEAGAIVVGSMLLMGPRIGGAAEHHGVMMGAAAGVLIGVSDIAIKAMTDLAGSSGVFAALLTPWLLIAVVMSIVSFYAVARGLQIGEAVPVIAMISVAANVVQIIGGLIVFDDPMPTGTLGIVAQAAGFLLVCAAAVLLPAPTRAVEPAGAIA